MLIRRCRRSIPDSCCGIARPFVRRKRAFEVLCSHSLWWTSNEASKTQRYQWSLQAELSTSLSYRTAEWYGRSHRAHGTCKFSGSVALAAERCDRIPAASTSVVLGLTARVLIREWDIYYMFFP